MNKTQLYATQSLAACGFAVMASVAAFRLRPDLWASGQDCAFDFKPNSTRIEGTSRVMATIPGVGIMPVLTRSTDQLAQRIEWVTGFKVEKIENEPTEKPAPSLAAKTEAERKEDERLAQIKALAAQEPPAHDCHLRKEILAARAEVEKLAA